MPLNTAQKKVIEDTIGYLLEFPHNENLFYSAEINLLYMFLFSLNVKNPYHEIRKYFFHPELYFQHMMIDEPITYGDIKDYILDLATERMRLTNNDPHLWNKSTVRFRFYQPDWEAPFPGIVNNEDLSQVGSALDTIYTQKLVIADRCLYVEMVIELDNTASLARIKLENFRSENFLTDTDEREYMRKAKKRAEICAAENAAIMAIDYLVKRFNLPKNAAAKIRDSQHAKNLIIQRYFFNAALKQEFKLLDFTFLSERQYRNLSWETAIHLMKDGTLTKLQVRNLTTPQTICIDHPAYFSLLKTKNILPETLENVSLPRALFLIHPHIINLVQADNKNLSEFRHLWRDAQAIFLDPNYYQFFLKNKIDWLTLKTITKSSLLLFLDKHIISFITNNILSFANVIALRVNKQPQDSLLDVGIFAYTSRLQKLVMNTPLKINDAPDTMTTFIADLALYVIEQQQDYAKLKDVILRAFLDLLKSDLEKRKSEPHDTMANCASYQVFFNIIDSNKDLSYILSKLLIQVDDTKTRINSNHEETSDARQKASAYSTEITLFAGQPSEKKRRLSGYDEKLFQFCEGISVLDLLNETAEPKNTYCFK